MKPANIFSRLIPDLRVDRIHQIDLEQLSALQRDTLLIDLDNTLTSWRGTSIETEVEQWVVRALSQGFRIALVSNASPARLLPHGEMLRLEHVYPRAGKPSVRTLRRAMSALGAEPSQTVMIGDQLFTDVLAGNRAGVYTVLVTPMDLREQWWMKMVRNLERKILDWLHRHL